MNTEQALNIIKNLANLSVKHGVFDNIVDVTVVNNAIATIEQELMSQTQEKPKK